MTCIPKENNSLFEVLYNNPIAVQNRPFIFVVQEQKFTAKILTVGEFLRTDMDVILKNVIMQIIDDNLTFVRDVDHHGRLYG